MRRLPFDQFRSNQQWHRQFTSLRRIQLQVSSRYHFARLGTDSFNPDLFENGFPLHSLTGNDLETLTQPPLPIEPFGLDQRTPVFRNPYPHGALGWVAGRGWG